MHIVYYPSTLGLVPDDLSHIGVDSDIPTMVSPVDNTEALVLLSLETILVKPSFLSRVR